MRRILPPIPDLPQHLPQNVTATPEQLLSSHENQITQSPPESLLGCLASGRWTSQEVTLAFLRRAGLAQKLVNCVTELLPEKALSRATELDRYMANFHKPVGPLHGLPISVKEHIGMEGLACNAGYVAWANNIPTVDAFILKILWDAGCVFFVRTTQPQTLVVLASKPWTIDPSLVPIPWRNDTRQPQEYDDLDLKIAVMWSDDVVTPHPSVRRALEMMVEQLKTMHEVDVVDWRPYDHKRAWEIIVRSERSHSYLQRRCFAKCEQAGLYYVDGGKDTKDLLAATQEPWRPLSEFIITDNPHVKDRTRAEIQELIESMEEYRLEYAGSELLCLS
ncbi:MAG: hypothetical protein Q9208_008533 [Pyrenodesmia sp. 3 TL-2023]